MIAMIASTTDSWPVEGRPDARSMVLCLPELFWSGWAAAPLLADAVLPAPAAIGSRPELPSWEPDPGNAPVLNPPSLKTPSPLPRGTTCAGTGITLPGSVWPGVSVEFEPPPVLPLPGLDPLRSGSWTPIVGRLMPGTPRVGNW